MSLDIHPERTRVLPERKPRLIIPVLIWIGLLLGVGMLLVGLSGCADTAEIRAEVCYLKFMGNTEDGYTVVMSACQSPEKFAESQQ